MSRSRTQSRSWRRLSQATGQIPSLLVSTDFTAQSYTIQLTDLTNVWSENLDKRPIIMRGLKEDSSIDPTDGPDQIRKLLDLLHAAFDPTFPGHRDTSLAISGGSSDDDDDKLIVHVTAILPGGLRPLKWPVYLKKSPQSAITARIVLPLIRAHHARAHELSELVSALREKDAVIAKLVDKLEATGTGLEHVFTSLSGRRKVTRATAEDRVRGLAPFSEAGFYKQSASAQSDTSTADIPSLLDSVFGSAGLPLGDDLDFDDSPAPRDWWTSLTGRRQIVLQERAEKDSEERDAGVRQQTRSGGKDHEEAEGDDFQGQDSSASSHSTCHAKPSREPGENDKSDDDDFQVQAAPPSRKRGTEPLAGPADGPVNESPDGEPARTPPHQHAHRPPTSRPAAANQGTKASSSPPPAEDDGSPTASDTDDPSPPPPPPPPPPTAAGGKGDAGAPAEVAAAPAAPPRRGRLGRIGGGRPARSASPPAGGAEAGGQLAAPRRGRLGAIGRGRGRGGESTVPGEVKGCEDGEGERESYVEGARGEKPARVTSVERADRKRAELQRELERRAAGPAKKKRKF